MDVRTSAASKWEENKNQIDEKYQESVDLMNQSEAILKFWDEIVNQNKSLEDKVREQAETVSFTANS